MLRRQLLRCGQSLVSNSLLGGKSYVPSRAICITQSVCSEKDASKDEPADVNGSEEKAEEKPVDEMINKFEVLQNEVRDLKEKNTQLNDKVLRTLAEAENTRRIARQDVQNTRDFAITKFAKSLLDVSDNLKRAHESINIEELKPEHSMEAIKLLHEGVVMTEQQLQKVFHSFGITRFCDAGDKFDPNLHEAMFEYEDADKESGVVGQVIKVGYSLNGRVVRPAQVGTIKQKSQPKHE